MIPVDFHSHTFFSNCGIHSHVEMLTRARELGMEGLAITDHGRDAGGRIPSPFFKRLTDPVPGIRMMKGIEANLRGLKGDIDVPDDILPYLDIVLLGFHSNTPAGLGEKIYTDALIAAIEQNPCVDMLTHLLPYPADHGVDIVRIVRAAKSCGVVIELNNSKLMLERVEAALVHQLVRTCKSEGCRMAVCSDAHALNEVGCDSHALEILKMESFPEELWVNQTAEKAFDFIEERRVNKAGA